MDNTDIYFEMKTKLRELGIRYDELAEVTGVSKRTVQRYFTEERMPASKRTAIEKHIRERSVYRGYSHMARADFSELLNSLFDEFKERITQSQLAERSHTGITQSYVSELADKGGYIRASSAEIQYKLLSVFYHLCIVFRDNNTVRFYKDHRRTGIRLRYLLHRTDDTISPDEKLNTVTDAIFGFTDTLPEEQQDIIASAPLAFFDSLLGRIKKIDIVVYQFDSDAVISYVSAVPLISAFRELDKDQKRAFADLLKKAAADHHFSYAAEKDYITMIERYSFADSYAEVYAHYIKSDATETIFDDRPAVKQDISAVKRSMEKYISMTDPYLLENEYSGAFAEKVEEDIRFRLTMNAFEWDIWHLYAVCYDFSDAFLHELKNKAIACEYIDRITDYVECLPEKDMLRVLSRPMAFFDSMSIYKSSYLSFYEEAYSVKRSDTENVMSSLINEPELSSIHKIRNCEKYKERILHGRIMNYRRAIASAADEIRHISLCGNGFFGYADTDMYYGGDELSRLKELLLSFDIYKSSDPHEYKALAEKVIKDIKFRLISSERIWKLWLLKLDRKISAQLSLELCIPDSVIKETYGFTDFEMQMFEDEDP